MVEETEEKILVEEVEKVAKKIWREKVVEIENLEKKHKQLVIASSKPTSLEFKVFKSILSHMGYSHFKAKGILRIVTKK